MSRYLRVVAVWVCLFALGGSAAANSDTEAVTNFVQTTTLDHTGNLMVNDEIDYDFGTTPPHSVSYKIPISYHDDQGAEYRMNFDLISSQLHGTKASFNPLITPTTAILTLPAGSGDTTTRHYSLRYRLGPVLLDGNSNDNLKFVVTGLAWSVPINHILLTFNTPIAPADNLTCYTGQQGSTSGACTVNQTGKTATVESSSALPVGQGLSIFADFPHHSVDTYLLAYDPHTITITGLALRGLLALVLFVGLVILLSRWRRRRIVTKKPSDYTNANETSKDQAHRK
jgi:hypothetical protein